MSLKLELTQALLSMLLSAQFNTGIELWAMPCCLSLTNIPVSPLALNDGVIEQNNCQDSSQLVLTVN